jgi:MFS-type transporter involved in bile tolerance (Atg22 family)
MPIAAYVVVFFISAIAIFFIGKFAEMQAYRTSMPALYSTIAIISNFMLVFVQPNSFVGYWACAIGSCVIWGVAFTTTFRLLLRSTPYRV